MAVSTSALSSGTLRAGEAERARPLPEGGHGHREPGDGDGAAVSHRCGGSAAGRRQAHSGDPEKCWH